jgi:ribosomal protein S18 acetylase RimI-like enzyme
MSRNLLPVKWKTQRLRVENSTLAEAPDLQHINDLVPQTHGWTHVEYPDDSPDSILTALQEGVLPPTPDRSAEFFRLQSIRLDSTGDLIGFLGVYHGFPEEDIFWINTITFHPNFQSRGYGPELLKGLCEVVHQSGSYTRMRTYVSLDNWPSLRMCIKAGLNKMIEIAGDKVHSDQADAHVLVEKSFGGE